MVGIEGSVTLKALRSAAVASVMALACAGCVTTSADNSVQAAPASPGVPPEDQYVPTNEPTVVARQHFERGHYGLAERYFREAVEKDARDLDSWVGLGATYDQLKRFDLADRAYLQAFRLGGPTVPLLNNMGYSYLLRGDTRRARAAFDHALKLDPANEVVRNNIRLLNGAPKPVPAPHP